jgi:hypothetical protein
MTLSNSLGDLILIVGAVGGKRSTWIGDLVEQSVSHRCIVDILADNATATISPLSASMPICSLRQDRRRYVPCFSTNHRRHARRRVARRLGTTAVQEHQGCKRDQSSSRPSVRRPFAPDLLTVIRH